MNKIKKVLGSFLATFILASVLIGCKSKETALFEITYNSSLELDGYDGRLLLIISKDTLKEPRFQINDSDETGILIGKNVNQWTSEQKQFFTSSNLAYPIESLNELESGTYFVQALLHKYDTFNSIFHSYLTNNIINQLNKEIKHVSN